MSHEASVPVSGLVSRGLPGGPRVAPGWSPSWPLGPSEAAVLRGSGPLFEALRPWAFEPQRLSVSFVTAKRGDIMAEHRDNGCSVVAGQQGCYFFILFMYIYCPELHK